jgi:hypothetical protein
MNRYLVRFENMAVFSVTELSEGVLLAISGNHVVDENLETIKTSLDIAGIDTTKIDEYKEQQTT